MDKQQELFLKLVRLGIRTDFNLNDNHNLFEGVDWEAIKALAEEQGLTGVLADGLEQVPQEMRPPKPVMLQLIGEVLNGYEYRYELYRRAVAEMASFYNSHDCKMMVLKGYACSLNWPKPEHRPVGDIDIWQFGEYKKADALLVSEKGIEVDNSHHHHTVFNWRDFMVENHYDFINVHHRKSNVGLERILKALGSASNLDVNDRSALPLGSSKNHSDNGDLEPGTLNLEPAPNAKGFRHGCVELYGEKVYIPSPNLHALFLLKHLMNDFTSVSITFRQLLDWAFHVQRYTKEIDWNWLTGVLAEYHMVDFYNCINAICVEDLGFPPSMFPSVQFDPQIKARVLNDILSPEYVRGEPKKLFARLVYKYKRWNGNAWKQELCYAESRWSAFWSGVWNHILKPSSI